ncbi:MAG TPA: hypothetical protein VF411_15705 [Bacteroidia bacterium]
MVLLLSASCKRKVISDSKPFSLSGSNWTEVGNHGYEGPNPLSSLFIDSTGNIFSSGKTYQTTIGGYNYNVDYVTKWNGVYWQQLGTGTNSLNANAYISNICKDNSGNLYAAGMFTDSTFVSSYWCHPTGNAYIAKWDGIKWSNLGGKGSLPAQYISSIVFNPTNGYLYAAVVKSYNPTFDYDIYFWNGSVWATIDNSNTKLNRSAIKLYVDNNGNLYAGGTFTNSSGKYFVAKWSGTNWIELGAGGNELNANGNIETICGDATGNIYAAGDFTNAIGNNFVAKWDGTKWTELGGINALAGNGRIISICIDGAGNLYAGGSMSYKIDAFDMCYYVAKWNGSNWSIIGKNTLFASGGFNQLSVNSTGTIYAVGSFANAAKNCYVGSYP